jgi:hypothetical protein
MSDQVRQAVARERLRARLVDLRKHNRLSPQTVTTRTHWSASKLNRIETGAVTVQPTDLEALLTLYGVRDQTEIAGLVSLAVIARERRWWSSYRLDTDYREFVAYESEASTLTAYQALVIPGLLQTEPYARAVTPSFVGRKSNDEDLQGLIDVRLRRQAELFARMSGDNPPKLIVMLDGAVLERPVGGTGVMRAQLDRILEIAQHDRVKLVVVPLRQNTRPAPGGFFELLEFPGPADPDVVFVESPVRDFLVKDEEITTLYHDIVEGIAGSGLTRDAAVDEVRRARAAL